MCATFLMGKTVKSLSRTEPFWAQIGLAASAGFEEYYGTIHGVGSY